MKKKVINSLSIKLSFEKGVENPSRLFNSFAKMIDGVSTFDKLIAQSINTSVSSKVNLDDIEKGSLIAKIRDTLIINEDEKIENPQNEENISEYIRVSRGKTLELIQDGKNDINNLSKLSDEIDEIASRLNLKDGLNYRRPDMIPLAESINLINDSTSELSEEENFKVKDEAGKKYTVSSQSRKFDIEEVKKALTEKTLENRYKQILKIKRPDFLGDAKWDFKHGNKPISAKIKHFEWLEDFHNGEVVVVPGDSLEVSILHKAAYNKNGYLIQEEIDIVKVKNVIHNR